MSGLDSHEVGWDGPLTVRVGQMEVRLRGRLRGMFDPIDGHYHWYGRLESSDALAKLASRAPAEVEVVTEQGSAFGSLGDPDMWGRLRLAGFGPPPFAVPTLDDLDDLDDPRDSRGSDHAPAGRASD